MLIDVVFGSALAVKRLGRAVLCADFVAGAALCEPQSADVVASTASCERADFVAE